MGQLVSEPALQWLQSAVMVTPLDDQEKRTLAGLAEARSLPAGEALVHEGELADSLFLVQQGTLVVRKNPVKHGKVFTLGQLEAGDVAGEMGLFDSQVAHRSASLIAQAPTQVLEISYAALNAHPVIKQKLGMAIYQQLSQRLNDGNALTVSALQTKLDEQEKRHALGVFVVRSLYVITLYALTIAVLKQQQVSAQFTSWLSLPLILVVALTVYRSMRQTGYPLRQFGLGLTHWQRHCWQAVWYSLPVMAAMLVGKALYLRSDPDNPALSAQQLIDPFREFNTNGEFSLTLYSISFLAYTLLCPLQELIVRGGLQAPLMQFLPGSNIRRNWNAILLSNLVFAMMHIHLSAWFALLTVFLGLFWGWLFTRQGNLPGVIFSHWLIGVWGVYVMGNPFFLI